MAKTRMHRPKARRPRGFEDRTARVLRTERALADAVSRVYERWGFEPLQTPAFEYADALGKFLPDEERPNEGVFAVRDDDAQWMALRYDLTAPLARFVAENFQDIAKPFRRYQFGDVWRNEKPGPGRFRQFVQCDADSVGAPGPVADAEMIALASEVMMDVRGLSDKEYVIRVNDRRFLDGVMEFLGDATRERRLRVLRAIDKIDRVGFQGLEQLLGEGRKDKSGDFTEGAGLDADQRRHVLDFVKIGVKDASDKTAHNAQVFEQLTRVLGDTDAGKRAVVDMETIAAVLDALGKSDNWRLDTSVVRGLGYYTGPVFEAELLAEAIHEGGSPIRFGSVGGGGRYDDLVTRFTGQAVPATGFSFGVSRFAAILGWRDVDEADPLVLIVAVEKDRMAEYFALVRDLRQAELGLRAEVFIGGGGMSKQLKYADQRDAAFAVIIGSTEREKGEAQIKDLALGARLASEISSNKIWREDQPAQFTVPRAKIADAIRDRLKSRSA